MKFFEDLLFSFYAGIMKKDWKYLHNPKILTIKGSTL